MRTIRAATAHDLLAIGAIESAAERLFHEAGVAIGATAASEDDAAEYAAACSDGRLLVAEADGRCVGFVLIDTIDGQPHVEEMDVHPDQQRQGIGRDLLLAAFQWARDRGASRLTLSTFRALPWNAPFYARHGFRELAEAEWTPGLRALRAYEEAHGLVLAERCVMALELTE